MTAMHHSGLHKGGIIMSKKIIYISSPYTIGDQVANVRRQILVADKLLGMGYIPFCPCLSHFWHFVSPKPWETWLEIDIAIIPKCDALLRLDGESKGADKEVALAKELGIPIFYSLKDLDAKTN